MLIMDEIIKHYGGIKQLQEAGELRIRRGRRLLILEYLGFGPSGDHAARVIRYADHESPVPEPELHFEWKEVVWLPYYLCNGRTGGELFLYRFNAEQHTLHVDPGAGARMIEIAGILDLSLWAEGFVEAAAENQYHPLFSVEGGAA